MPNINIFFIVTIQLLFIGLSNGWFFFSDSNCYTNPDVGCFPTSGVYNNAMGFAPQSPSEVGVRFVYRGMNRNITFSLVEAQQRLRDTFNPSLKTVLIIHGYLESTRRPWVGHMVNALRTRGPMNIFLVDWRDGALNINYLQSVANARMAGAITGLFLQELIQMGASPRNFHIIGFSLGAQVAGYVGERVRGIGRITGLDPAGPGFIDTHPTVRLDPTDAVVVDVVHTDRDIGTLMSMGTVDFYPNGGADQPSCGVGAFSRLSAFMSQLDFSRNTVTRTVGCSHIRATELFTSSIYNNCTYVLTESRDVRDMRNNAGTVCLGNTCPKFGYYLDLFQTPRHGIFRFPTTGSHPYCCK